MLQIRILLPALMFGAVAVVAQPPMAAAALDPAAIISDLDSQAAVILAPNVPRSARQAEFERLFRADFDVRAIAQFVLGPIWRAESEPERQQFMDLFASYTAGIYAAKLADFSGARLRILDTRTGPDGALVETEAGSSKLAAPIRIGWRLNRYGDEWKISDVIVDNVSMAVTQRAKFAEVIARSGGNVQPLLEMMREKAANPDEAEK